MGYKTYHEALDEAQAEAEMIPTRQGLTNLTVLIMARDEERNIAECVRTAYAHWIAVGAKVRFFLADTGSNDHTVERFAAVCEEVGTEYEFAEFVWHNFGRNRSLALEAVRKWRKRSGFTLFLDADDRILRSDTMFSDEYSAYTVQYVHGDMRFHRVSVFNNNVDWYYKGVLHEFPCCDAEHRMGGTDIEIRAGVSGKRSQDPLKYIHDADLIAKEILTEADPTMCARYYFYLAQSYRDAQHLGAAIYWYERVLYNVGNWSEERYVAALHLGRLKNPSYFVTATVINPDRAEAWRAMGDHETANGCIQQPGWLFVETTAYQRVV